MPDTITLAGRPVSLSGDPIKVHGKVITPNGLADAVFEGGGAKGFGQVGALAFAEEIGIRWVNIAGTSAGAIVASLLAAGYTPTEITEIMGEIDFRKFMDESLLDRLPLFLGKAMSIVFQKGVFEGRYFSKTIAKYLARRNVRTFRDLVIPEFANDPRYRYRLRVVASDISRGKMLVLPQDIVDYGLAPDDLSVAAALRMSMSIPFVFEPVKQRLPGGEVCYIVDGGLLSNYPVHLFDEEGTPAWPTFGFMMKEPSEERLVPHRIRGPITMGMATFNTMFSAMDDRYIQETNWDRTIAIPTLGVKTTEFDLSPDRRRELYAEGYKAARKFFGWWDWDTHVRARLAGKPMELV